MRHLTAVALVIVSGKVQQAVERQDFQFVSSGMAETTRIFGSDFRRDGYVADEIPTLLFAQGVAPGGKREHVRGVVLAAKAAVQVAQFPAGGHDDVHPSVQTRRALRTADKAGQRAFTGAGDRFSKYDQTLSPTTACIVGLRKSPTLCSAQGRAPSWARKCEREGLEPPSRRDSFLVYSSADISAGFTSEFGAAAWPLPFVLAALLPFPTMENDNCASAMRALKSS